MPDRTMPQERVTRQGVRNLDSPGCNGRRRGQPVVQCLKCCGRGAVDYGVVFGVETCDRCGGSGFMPFGRDYWRV